MFLTDYGENLVLVFSRLFIVAVLAYACRNLFDRILGKCSAKNASYVDSMSLVYGICTSLCTVADKK